MVTTIFAGFFTASFFFQVSHCQWQSSGINWNAMALTATDSKIDGVFRNFGLFAGLMSYRFGNFDDAILSISFNSCI